MDTLKSPMVRRMCVVFVGLLLCVVLAVQSGFIGGSAREDELNIQRGRVISADNSGLFSDPLIDGLYIGRQILEVELLTGEFTGQAFRIENVKSRFFNHMGSEGMELLFFVDVRDGAVTNVEVFNHSRDRFMYVFAVMFALVLVAVGGMKGLYSVVSLVFTLSVVLFFVLPNIIGGGNPVGVAVFAAALIAVFSVLLVNDFSFKSLAAIGGTVAGVAIAGLIGVLSGVAANVSGLHMEHAQEVMHQAGRDAVIRLPMLLPAGIIIAALGAVMDIGVTISSAVFEMKKLKPDLDFAALYKSGMNIGRDIIGTMSNTLILAFAGSSVMVLVIIALYELPFLRLINMNLLAVEVIQGLSASFGLVLTVPVTAALAAALAGKIRHVT